MNNYPLFLPSVVKTYGKDTNSATSNLLIDSTVRLAETRKALFEMVKRKYFNQIVIVDGSNTEILTKKEISEFAQKGVIIEQLLFQQNMSEVSKFGKSNGEMQINNYTITNSVLIKKAGGFTKITPRYVLNNIDKIIPKINNEKNIFYLYAPSIIPNENKFVCTIFFKTSLEFYKRYLEDSILECKKETNGILESIFYRKLTKIKTRKVFVEFPHFKGIASTTGNNITNRYFFVRNIFSKLGFMCKSFEN